MEMRLTPLDAGGQRCESSRLVTDPPADVMGYVDRFGNRVRHFETLAPHERLVVTAVSEVQTPDGHGDPERELSLLDSYDYLQPTAYAPVSEAVRTFAAPCARGDDAGTALEVMRAVRTALRYEPGSTTVRTTAEEALLRGQGVCQDFSHLMIACCRSLGLAARYVSGYVFSPRHDTAAASHAWTDVFARGKGWISLDATHDSLQTENYVRLAVGRDYADVPPTRGIYKGAGRESMEIEVRLEPMV
jgi:transglutaminase-like putative cysteine protease